ncbi:MAG: hypothetical protein NVSMB44_37510 [Ktedonobacteraceae bacterium]
MAIRVCVAGATCWTGSAVTEAILASSEFQLVGAVARRQAGRDIGEVLGRGRANLNIVASLEEALAAPIDGTQVHSIRVPGYIIAFETIFGLPEERLSIRHDAGSGAEPYVSGTLLAARKVLEVNGLVRGLDRLLFH